MPHSKRFLILTNDSGFGHRSAANSIAKALEIRHPGDATSSVVNPIIAEPATHFLQKTERDYDRTVKNNPDWYRFTYAISDSRPASLLVENTLVLALYKNLKRLVLETKPDAIVNTTQMFNAPCGAVLRSLRWNCPLFTAVTDLADVHAMWFTPHPDRFFVASDWVKAKALACGVPPAKIQICGIPVDPEFALPARTQAETRALLGLDPQRTTLLIVGSRRVSGIHDHLMALDGLALPFQVVVIAGGDDALYAQCTAHTWRFPIQVHNYVTNMPDWMRCADLLVTKAGGLVLSEGLAAGLPSVLIDYLPGQEEGNVRFILDNLAGAMVTSAAGFGDLVERWLKNDQAHLKATARNARRLGHPDAALVIADATWQAADKPHAHPAQRSAAWRISE